MIRITLDTNERVSAFNFGGQTLSILSIIDDAVAGDIEIAISEPIIKETLRPAREIRLAPLPAAGAWRNGPQNIYIGRAEANGKASGR